MGIEPGAGTEESPGPDASRFQLAIRGTSVELVVYPQPEGGRAVNAGEVCAALGDFPLDSYQSDRVYAAVKAPSGAAVVVGRIEAADESGEGWAVKVSPSRIAAFAIPLVEEDASAAESMGPPFIDEASLRERLASLGVTYGLLDDVLAGFASGQPLESVVLVASGTPAESGRNALVELTFDANPQITPVQQEDGSVDYRAAVVTRFVEAGAVLATRRPPEQGQPGRDVLGTELPARPVLDRSLVPYRGKGTEIQGDTLVATSAGRPVVRGEKVEVLPVYEVRADVDFSVGNIDFIGDVVIGGDVKPGFTIRAGGSVTVRGIVDHATIVAGRDVMVRGVSGDARSRIEAGNQVVAHYLHGVAVTAGALVKVHREIINCTIRAPRVETAATGMVVGGAIEAIEEVDAGAIGSMQAVPTQVTVTTGNEGHPPVVRARRGIHLGVTLRVHPAITQIDDDYPGSSFWENEAGEISRLGPASSAPPKAA